MVRRGRPLEMQAEGLLLLTNDLKLACYRRQMDINRRTFKSLVLFV
jgi:16S rRNA U516 pseudouridylate synthase RsuA-like enzyme